LKWALTLSETQYLTTKVAVTQTKPASEYIDREIYQKPMLKTRHSRLQGRLIRTINEIVEDAEIVYTFPELRCMYRSILLFLLNQQPALCSGGDRVPVPDAIPLDLTSDLIFGWLRMKE
jgi:Uma2 family endonuclease